MEYVNVLLIVLFICMFAYVILNRSSTLVRNQRSLMITVPATLSDKRIQENENMHFGFGIQPEKERYYLIFLTEDGSSLEYRVTRADFYDFEIWTLGKMTYQGSSYKGFESDQN